MNTILFEIIRGNKVVMSTTSEECIYPNDILKHMKKNGYKILLDGKPYDIKKQEIKFKY